MFAKNYCFFMQKNVKNVAFFENICYNNYACININSANVPTD